MQLGILLSKAPSSLRDICHNNGIKLQSEKRIPALRLLREHCTLVSQYATCVSLITISGARKLVKALHDTTNLARLLGDLESSAPPALFNRYGPRRDASLYERRLGPGAPAIRAPDEPDVIFPVTLPTIALDPGQLREKYGLPLESCPKRLKEELRVYEKWCMAPINTSRYGIHFILTCIRVCVILSLFLSPHLLIQLPGPFSHPQPLFLIPDLNSTPILRSLAYAAPVQTTTIGKNTTNILGFLGYCVLHQSILIEHLDLTAFLDANFIVGFLGYLDARKVSR